jgi:hypothetical protein
VIVIACSVLIMGASVWLAAEYLLTCGTTLSEPYRKSFDLEMISYALIVVSVIIAVYIIVKSLLHKYFLPVVLVILQLAVLAVFETIYALKLTIISEMPSQSDTYYDERSRPTESRWVFEMLLAE